MSTVSGRERATQNGLPGGGGRRPGAPAAITETGTACRAARGPCTTPRGHPRRRLPLRVHSTGQLKPRWVKWAGTRGQKARHALVARTAPTGMLGACCGPSSSPSRRRLRPRPYSSPPSILLSATRTHRPSQLCHTNSPQPAGWAKWVARTVEGGRCPPAMNPSGAATHHKRDKSLASRFWTAAVGTIRVTAAGPACAGCRLRRDARCDAARRPPRRDPLAVARKMWRLHPHGCPGPPGGAPRPPRGAAWRPWTAVRMRAGRPWPGAARPRAWHMRAHARWRARWRAARVPALTPGCAGQIPLLDTARRRTT